MAVVEVTAEDAEVRTKWRCKIQCGDSWDDAERNRMKKKKNTWDEHSLLTFLLAPPSLPIGLWRRPTSPGRKTDKQEVIDEL